MCRGNKFGPINLLPENTGEYSYHSLHDKSIVSHKILINQFPNIDIDCGFHLNVSFFKKHLSSSGLKSLVASDYYDRYRKSFYLRHDVFLYLRYKGISCRVLEYIYCKMFKGIEQLQSPFLRCFEYEVDMRCGGEEWNKYAELYREGVGSRNKIWDYWASIINSQVGNQKCLVFPMGVMTSFISKNNLVVIPSLPFYTFLRRAPFRKYYFLPIFLHVDNEGHCAVIKLSTLKFRVELFDPRHPVNGIDDSNVARHCVVIAHFLNAVKFHVTTSAGKPWSGGYIHTSLRQNLPWLKDSTCLLNCILFVDRHLDNTILRPYNGIIQDEASDDLETKLNSLVYHAPNKVANGMYELFALFKGSPVRYCESCAEMGYPTTGHAPMKPARNPIHSVLRQPQIL